MSGIKILLAIKEMNEYELEMSDWCPKCNAGPGRCSCPWW